MQYRVYCIKLNQIKFSFSFVSEASELKKSFISGSTNSQHEDLKRDKAELLKVLTKLSKGNHCDF